VNRDRFIVRLPRWDGLYSNLEEIQGLTSIQQHLSAVGARVPVVMITGHDEIGAEEACLAAGVSSYLCKPLDRSVLLEAIERAISSFAERRAHS
jgi:FixJ family two-component response regulator